MTKTKECEPFCDFEKAVVPERAVFLCAKCHRDFSLEYLFWAFAAHPEWLEPKRKERKHE